MERNSNGHGPNSGLHKRVLWRGKPVFTVDPDSAIAEVFAQFAADHPEQVSVLTEEEMRELAQAPELPPEPLPVTWTTSLREIRHERDLSLQALSRLSGAAYRTLSMIECGKRVPSWRTIRKISDALGLHPDEIAEFAEVRSVEAAKIGANRHRKAS